MKAVVLAGGEGARMRPLTCDVPKSLLRLCGKPNIEYVLDMLFAAGCDEAIVTTCYLADDVKAYIEESAASRYSGMVLRVVEESEPRGTAGSVKNASAQFGRKVNVNSQVDTFEEVRNGSSRNGGTGIAGLTEPFLVISGDSICDFDLKKFRDMHVESNNELSILLSHVKDPREYGLVRLNKLGKVSEFIEKPDWSRATGDLASTGIYFVSPSVMNYIPNSGHFDFARDLFPLMMRENKIIGGFEFSGYWSDVGDIPSYIRTQFDMMFKKVETGLNISSSFVSTADGKIPGGKYKIIPPVYIGKNVSVGEGSLIGPGTVLDDGCVVGTNAHVKGSILLPNSRVESGVRVTGAVLASGSTVKNGAELFDGAVLGSNSIVGDKTTVLQNVLIWPAKLISPRVRVYENVIVTPPERNIFDDAGVFGSVDGELLPEMCARLGKACASMKSGIKIGIATDGSRTAKVLKMALQAGAMASGAYIWDFGEAFMAQMPFFASFCGLDIGVFIGGDGTPHSNNARLTFCDSDGLPLKRSKEREIERKIAKSDFARSDIDKGRDISSITSIRLIYSQELCRVAKGNLSGLSLAVECENPEIARLLRDSLERLECSYSDELTAKISKEGNKVSMVERGFPEVSSDVLLAICCLNEFRDGKDVALPGDAPGVINDIAKMYSRKVLRFYDSSNEKSDDNARRLAACQNWSKDALFMTVKLLTIMRDRKKYLHELVEEIPKFYITGREMAINFSPVRLVEIFKDDLGQTAFASEGVAISHGDAKAVLTPSKKGNRVKVLVEADTMEAAEEFGSKIQGKLAAEITKNGSAKMTKQ